MHLSTERPRGQSTTHLSLMLDSVRFVWDFWSWWQYVNGNFFSWKVWTTINPPLEGKEPHWTSVFSNLLAQHVIEHFNNSVTLVLNCVTSQTLRTSRSSWDRASPGLTEAALQNHTRTKSHKKIKWPVYGLQWLLLAQIHRLKKFQLFFKSTVALECIRTPL